MGLKWNNESNDQEDRTGRANWTNGRIYLELLKTHCDLLGPVHDGHSFEKRQRPTNAQSILVWNRCDVVECTFVHKQQT